MTITIVWVDRISKARTAAVTGEKSPFCDPGSELRLQGGEKRKSKIINGMEKIMYIYGRFPSYLLATREPPEFLCSKYDRQSSAAGLICFSHRKPVVLPPRHLVPAVYHTCYDAVEGVD